MTSDHVDIPDLATQFIAEDRSLNRYLDSMLARIDSVDPELHAMVEEADRSGRIKSRKRDLSETTDSDSMSLYGIPVGIKDIIHVDGLTTSAGTALPPELFQGPEAEVVSDLKAAGAIIAGKTVTTEFAGSAPGPTRNPFDRHHTPGGSSSGSAAGVAAGFFPAAIGTQTGGSVIRPAAFCGVVGFKPSFGRISRDGVLPRSETLDHVGIFSRSVTDAAAIAAVTCSDWSQIDSSDESPTLGIPEGPYLSRAPTPSQAAFSAQIEQLSTAGFPIERVRMFQDFDATDRLREAVAKAELAMHHADWFDDYRSFYRTTSADRIAAGFEVSIRSLVKGRNAVANRRRRAEEAMNEHDIDLWVCPAAPGPAPADLSTTGDSVMNRPWTDSGMPVLTVPAGTIDGLPLGLQCIGRYFEDETLMDWAQSIAEVVRPSAFTYPVEPT